MNKQKRWQMLLSYVIIGLVLLIINVVLVCCWQKGKGVLISLIVQTLLVMLPYIIVGYRHEKLKYFSHVNISLGVILIILTILQVTVSTKANFLIYFLISFEIINVICITISLIFGIVFFFDYLQSFKESLSMFKQYLKEI